MPDDDQPSPEDPNTFPPCRRSHRLDEAPDGRSPSDPDEPSPDSLPPGAHKPANHD